MLGFETSGRKVTTVKTTRGDISVEEVILAGGFWSTAMASELRIKVLMEPAKGYSVSYKRPPGFPSVPLAMAETKVVLTPMSDLVRFAGTLELSGFDMSINKRQGHAIIKAVFAYFPDIDTDALELIFQNYPLRLIQIEIT